MVLFRLRTCSILIIKLSGDNPCDWAAKSFCGWQEHGTEKPVPLALIICSICHRGLHLKFELLKEYLLCTELNCCRNHRERPLINEMFNKFSWHSVVVSVTNATASDFRSNKDQLLVSAFWLCALIYVYCIHSTVLQCELSSLNPWSKHHRFMPRSTEVSVRVMVTVLWNPRLDGFYGEHQIPCAGLFFSWKHQGNSVSDELFQHDV